MTTTAVTVDPGRCTHAAFHALTGEWPTTTIWDGAAMLERLVAAGYGYTAGYDAPATLAGLAKSLPSGRWYIYTAGHALALVDGELVDTEERGFDRRRILGMYPITAR